MGRLARLRAALRRRITIPLLRLQVRLGLLLVGLGVVVLLPVSGAVVVATNQPIFCSSCHEMGLHYATWRQSSHRSVACEECHLVPGVVNMVKMKLNALRQVREHATGEVQASAIQGHVSDENCKRCHSQTPALVTYHGLKITHRAHWNMGVGCTYCHARVVHGPKWLYEGVTSGGREERGGEPRARERVKTAATAAKFTPTMEVCYRCHDGKRASNKCSTCHVTLGERKPAVFDPAWAEAHREEVSREGEQDCLRCHISAFCDTCHRTANPHPGDWGERHPQEVAKGPARGGGQGGPRPAASCEHCHLAPAEKRPRRVEDLAFCRACHSLRREHRQGDWRVTHGPESLADPASCLRCHTQSWCSDCHAISRPHPQEWLARHPAEASRKSSNCQTCHTQQFCDACHKGKRGVPSSHDSDWLTRHQDAVGRDLRRPPPRGVGRAEAESCRVCHKADFCQGCHAKKAPVSHGRHWLSQHGMASKAQPAACMLCHMEKSCNECHGMTMPHPKLWLASHHKAAAEDSSLCERCHQRGSCETCHRGALPDSHRPRDWVGRHGGEAKGEGAQCSLCHREEFCFACHGMAMPHPGDWALTHKNQAGFGPDSVCYRCHKYQDRCAQCHGDTVPEQ